MEALTLIRQDVDFDHMLFAMYLENMELESFSFLKDSLVSRMAVATLEIKSRRFRLGSPIFGNVLASNILSPDASVAKLLRYVLQFSFCSVTRFSRTPILMGV